MEQFSARRLTGYNLLWDRPGSVLDVACSQVEAEAMVSAWTAALRRMLDALGWSDEELCIRHYPYGVSLALSAPIDALYAACEINEWAAAQACHTPPSDVPEAEFQSEVERLRQVIFEEQNPALLALRDAASARGIAFLSDDDDVSIGMGDGSMTWPVTSLPSPDDLPWPAFHDIPLGLVTGTNGKTSTTRIAASIIRAAGRSVGLSSTDGIRVDGELVESGDYSGPGGARTVLRDRRVSAAILETARGGILRRGLGVPCADAAVITTIAEDHAGDFGSRTTEELLEIKWVVSRALREGAPLILSADEALLVQRAPRASAPIIWFSLNSQNPVVCQHIAAGGQAALLREGELQLIGDGQTHVLCNASEVPLALGGAARHQLANALAAAAMTWSLGIPIDAIAKGLRTTTDNPGRGNLFDIDGRQVLVDFAHNPQAMQAIFDVASSLPARRRLLSFGQAGDRPDDAILKLAASAWSIGLDRAHVVDLPKYRRGRQTGEVSGLLERGMLEAGASATAISHYSSELASLEAALAWAEPGDLILMMALANSPDVLARLTALSRS